MFFTDDETEALPGIEEKPKFKRKQFKPLQREPVAVDLFTDDELMAAAHRETLVYDTECYPNYWLIAFKSVESGKVVYFEKSPVTDLHYEKLEWVLWNFKLVSFNGIKYDLPMITLAMAGLSVGELKEASDGIITGDMRQADIENRWNVRPLPLNHIDTFDVAPLPDISLKQYAGRIHAPRMQDLPFNPDHELSQADAEAIRNYCINDLDNTMLIYTLLAKQFELREVMGREYDQDLRSKSDAQIAEAVLVNEIAKVTNKYPRKPKIEPGTKYRYKIPEYIAFETPVLNELLDGLRNQDFQLDDSGYLMMPATIGTLQVIGKGDKPISEPGKGNVKINLFGKWYSVGMGGLHSNEESIAHIATDSVRLLDDDVESYYPRIILNQKLYPKHLGPVFLQVYETIVNRRIAAKKSGDKVTADSLKITINGSFGKLGSKYSALYSPDLLLQVTLTGQLSLLMLIERLELAGIPVISANTDGVVKKCPVELYETHQSILREWERITAFKTEQTEYKSVYSRDVNNYIALKLKGGAKGKGAFGNPWSGGDAVEIMKKNPEFVICVEAVTEYLDNGTPIEQTIRQATDVRKFVATRNVRGGAEKDDVFLGKVVRWYYAVGEAGAINNCMWGHTVPKTTGGKPLMDLPDTLPGDIDYDKYVDEATDLLYDIGYAKKPGTQTTFF